MHDGQRYGKPLENRLVFGKYCRNEDLTPRSESATAAIQVRFDCILFENLDETLGEDKGGHQTAYSANLVSFIGTPRV